MPFGSPEYDYEVHRIIGAERARETLVALEKEVASILAGQRVREERHGCEEDNQDG